MLHERGDEFSDFPQIDVDRAEHAKFTYLIKVIDAVDRAHLVAKEFIRELKSTDGTQAIMDFDWRGVVNHVQPQLQIVFLQDRHYRSDDQSFMRFPYAAVVARTAVVVVLSDGFELVSEVSDIQGNVNGATKALLTLETFCQQVGGTRAVDGMRTLNQLRRVLKSEL